MKPRLHSIGHLGPATWGHPTFPSHYPRLVPEFENTLPLLKETASPHPGCPANALSLLPDQLEHHLPYPFLYPPHVSPGPGKPTLLSPLRPTYLAWALHGNYTALSGFTQQWAPKGKRPCLKFIFESLVFVELSNVLKHISSPH